MPVPDNTQRTNNTPAVRPTAQAQEPGTASQSPPPHARHLRWCVLNVAVGTGQGRLHVQQTSYRVFTITLEIK